jgi:hypothetical protein
MLIKNRRCCGGIFKNRNKYCNQFDINRSENVSLIPIKSYLALICLVSSKLFFKLFYIFVYKENFDLILRKIFFFYFEQNVFFISFKKFKVFLLLFIDYIKFNL